MKQLKPFEPKHGVDDIQVIDSRGPWTTKSGGNLNVLFGLPQDQVTKFLDYNNPEFDFTEKSSGHNIRGLRSYMVSDIPKGSVGGKEWHKVRTEFVTAIGGLAVWQCVDFNGKEREFILDGKSSVLMPPGILHTYEALEDNTALQVIANTLFVPENPLTHDSYSIDTFNELRSTKH